MGETAAHFWASGGKALNFGFVNLLTALAWIKHRKGVVWASVIVLGLVLWGPMWLMSGLGLEAFPNDYRIYIGLVFVVSLVLALAPPLDAGYKYLALKYQVRQKQRRAREYIPHMTKRDRVIIGYLLHHNQKMFEANISGERAKRLVAKGIVKFALRHGQWFDDRSVPFEVPDHLWVVLEEHREQFPYSPDKDEERPWAYSIL